MKTLSLHTVVLAVLVLIFFLIHAWAHMHRASITSSLYGDTPWLDIPAHLLFGSALALAVLHPRIRSASYTPLAVFGFVMLVGIGWECIEYGYDIFYAIPRDLTAANHGMSDTMKDMSNNALSASAVLLFFYGGATRRSRVTDYHEHAPF